MCETVVVEAEEVFVYVWGWGWGVVVEEVEKYLERPEEKMIGWQNQDREWEREGGWNKGGLTSSPLVDTVPFPKPKPSPYPPPPPSPSSHHPPPYFSFPVLHLCPSLHDQTVVCPLAQLFVTPAPSKVEVVVLGSPSLTVLTVSVDAKQH